MRTHSLNNNFIKRGRKGEYELRNNHQINGDRVIGFILGGFKTVFYKVLFAQLN